MKVEELYAKDFDEVTSGGGGQWSKLGLVPNTNPPTVHKAKYIHRHDPPNVKDKNLWASV